MNNLKTREGTTTQNCGKVEQYRRAMSEMANTYLENTLKKLNKTDCNKSN